MSEQEMKDWSELLEAGEWVDDPLELLGRNRGKEKIVIPEGSGPDDGDTLG